MRKKIFTLFIMLLITVNNFAIMIDGLNYDLKQSNNKFTATVKSCVNYYSGDIVIPSTIDFLGDTYNVTAIGKDAFQNCTELTSITIPNSVTSIGLNAFYGCTNLKAVNIPNSVTSIGQYAFYECTNLKAVTIPNSVTSIGTYAFDKCTSLESIYILDLAAWCALRFENGKANPLLYAHNLYIQNELVTDLVIPEGVSSISSYAFYGFGGVKSISIPNSVTKIGEYVFTNCTNLTTINIPTSILSIYSGAFEGCSSLDRVYISDLAAWCAMEFKGIWSNPLSLSPNLYLQNELVTDLVIPEGVTSIPSNAFYDFGGLKSISIPNSVTKIGEYAFSGCTGLLSVTIPDSVKSIGANAFSYCTELTEVSIPNSVTSIGRYAFEGCSGLVSITIPQSVTSIGTNAFSNVKNIVYSGTAKGSPWGAKNVATEELFVEGYFTYSDETKEYLLACSTAAKGEIVIPNTVISIKEEAFDGCSGITSITVPATVTSIGYNAFIDILNIEYTGTASGSPWRAKNINKYVDGWFVYEDSQKLNLLGCSNAATGEIIIPNSVTTIGMSAFANCTGITSVVIPNSVTEIGYGAFSNCTNLTSITIPSSITSIGNQAFEKCNGLQAVYISDLTAWCSMYWGGSNRNPLHYAQNLYLNGELVTDLVIPEGITSISEEAFYNCTSITSLTIPNTVKEIKMDAFSLCKNLKTINLPNSIKSIESDAFGGCESLTSITLPDSVTSISGGTFYDCTSLTSVYIPTSVTSIDGAAFSGCKSLSSIKIPKSLKRIYYNSFSDCESLTGFEIPNGVTYIEQQAFSGCKGLTSIIIPDSVTIIGERAFQSCSGLTSVSIPNSVTTIGERAFSSCTNLTYIEIPDSVTSIGKNAFDNVKCVVYNGTASGSPWGAKSVITDYYEDGWFVYSDTTKSQIIACRPEAVGDVIISDSVESISNYAFRDCNKITSVTIPNSVTTIGVSAFANCTGITSVMIPNSVTSIGVDAFIGCENLYTVFLNSDSIASKTYTYKTSSDNSTLNKYFGEQVQKYIIGDSVTKIGAYAFGNCTNLRSVHFGNAVTAIANGAFIDCKNLSAITIPNSVTTLNTSTFRNCESLTSINIPNSVKSIQSFAFNYCTDLSLVTIGNSVDTILDGAFYSSNIKYIISSASNPPFCKKASVFANFNATLFVPKESLQAYSKANVWKSFNNILPITTAEETFINEPHFVSPSDTCATLAWQTIDNAIYYLLEIKENEEIVNKYVIDGNGCILKSLRSPASNKIGATQSNNGWKYLISGLTPNTTYTYTITAFVCEGISPMPMVSSFTTTGISTGLDQTNDQIGKCENAKILRDGQILIFRGDRTYTLTGQEVK